MPPTSPEFAASVFPVDLPNRERKTVADRICRFFGKALDESRIFQIAHAYEQSTDWHKARPAIEPIAA